MPSSMPKDALPVRRVAKAFLSASSALFILSSAFFFCSLSIVPPGNERPDRFAHYDFLDVARDVEVEHDDGKVVVHTQGNGRCIHDAEVLLQNVDVGEPVELGGGLVLDG